MNSDALAPAPELQAALKAQQFHGLPVWTTVPESAAFVDHWNPEQRTTLVKALRAGSEERSQKSLPKALEASLTTLEQPGTMAIITGQQPGFLCGPLYSLIKALQTCQVARAMSESSGHAIVPLFWNHADDHDIAEVHHSFIQNRNLDLQKVALGQLSSGRQPLSRIPIDPEAQGLEAVEALLQQNFGMYDHAQEALETLLPRAGETLPAAMTRAWIELMGQYGLIVVEPEWIRPQLSEALADLIAGDPRESLVAGSDSGSIPAEGAALLFRLDEEGRIAWRIHPDGFQEDQSERILSPAELSLAIRENPADWSPGALLRPLVQDRALPCLAYVGGFGELRYHGQLMPVREALDWQKTAFIARVSMTVIDQESGGSLEKSGLTVEEIVAAKGELQPATENTAPPSVIEEIQTIVAHAQSELRGRRKALAAIEPSLDNGLRRAADQMGQGIEKLLAKATRIHQNKGGGGLRHLRRLNQRLMPRGIPQERVLGPIEFSARYGHEWVHALYEIMPPMSSNHLVVTIRQEKSK